MEDYRGVCLPQVLLPPDGHPGEEHGGSGGVTNLPQMDGCFELSETPSGPG